MRLTVTTPRPINSTTIRGEGNFQIIALGVEVGRARTLAILADGRPRVRRARNTLNGEARVDSLHTLDNSHIDQRTSHRKNVTE